MLVIIVPFGDFRDAEKRQYQLAEFIKHFKKNISTLLNKNDVYIIISEQKSPTTYFNRGQLLNLGVHWVLENIGKPSIVIMHDVDILPNKKMLEQYYGKYKVKQLMPNSTTHQKLYGFQIGIGGGVSGFTYKVFAKFNGYPNTFWGWGGEDNAVQIRLKECKEKAIINRYGDYKNIDEQRTTNTKKMEYLKKNQLRNMIVWELLDEDKKSWNKNGYNNIAILGFRQLNATKLFSNQTKHVFEIHQVEFALDETNLQTTVDAIQKASK